MRRKKNHFKCVKEQKCAKFSCEKTRERNFLKDKEFSDKGKDNKKLIRVSVCALSDEEHASG